MNVGCRQLSLRRVLFGTGVWVVLWIGGAAAYAQVNGDTTKVGPQRDLEITPPASLDSVEAGAGAAPDTSSREKALVTADSLSAMVRQGERLQELFSNVDVKQDTTRLRSEYALRYLERDELLFTDDVVIFERGDTLRADTVLYNKNTKVGRASSNVRLTDGEVVVRAPKAIYYTDQKRSVFPDSVTLVDSARVLRAQEGTYWSDERRAEFSGNVHLTDENTHLESDSLTYFRDQERSIATGSVFIRRLETKERRGIDSTSLATDTSRADTSIVDTVSLAADTASADTVSADTVSVGDEPSQTPTDTASVAVDTTSITYLFGEWADNQEQNRYSRVERQALLVRVRMDSTGAPDDTLAVRARRLEATRTDTYHRLVAVDSVRIWQADMAAVADSAVYDRVVGVGPHDTTEAPSPLPDTTAAPNADPGATYESRLDSLVAQAELVGTGAYDWAPSSSKPSSPAEGSDTTETTPNAKPPETRPDTRELPASVQRQVAERRSVSDSVAVTDTSAAPPDTSSASGRTAQNRSGAPRSQWDTPSVQSEAKLPLEETRLFRAPVTWFERSQVWGDSIRVRALNRSLDTVYVRGSAFAAQEDTTVDRIRQLKGKNITAFFQRDSLRRIRAWPNGESIYFSASGDGALNGATRASADYVELYFRGKEVDRIKFGTGVQGTAYHKKKYIPDPFQLEGFQWTPERRPTRASLLREQRVRDRLDLDPLDRRPDERRPAVARAAAERPTSVDSLTTDSVTADSIGQRLRETRRRGTSEAEGGSEPTPQVRRERLPSPVDSLSVPSDSLRALPESRVPTIPNDTTESSSSNP